MKQEKITIGTEFPLDGILTLPDDMAQPVPAVVFVHGSGSSNMDEKVGKMTPFKDLAEGLARYGIASVRYDKRSYKYGFKMTRAGGITVKEETIEDAVFAADMLRKDGRIGKVYIAGHSMGGMLAPRIDAEGGNFDGLIIMAGSLRNFEQILKVQFADMLKDSKGIKKWILEKQTAKLMKGFENIETISDDEARKRKFGGGVNMYYFKEMYSFCAEEYLKNCEKPILVMQGDKDFQCKAEIDFTAYSKLLEGKENVTLRLYNGLNHCFVPAIYDSIAAGTKEYKTERHIGENVIKDMADWIKEA